MPLPLEKRNICFDLLGPEHGPVVCFGHSLSSDSGMWADRCRRCSPRWRTASSIAGSVPPSGSADRGAQHLCNVEFPEEFNRMLLDWIRANS